ncbi:MAG TPA: hypothetical protein VI306_11975 [Pyrinomonadaceae bacterium]
MKIRIPLSVALLVLLASVSFAAANPQRDHLTEQEVDLVKEAQALDKRVEVFIKATDRRLIVLNGTQAANAKLLKKDAELWGDLPAGSRAELIGDIARILDEAITNIDDVSSRDEKNPLIAKALRRLAAATSNIITQVAPFKEKASGDAEVSSFELLDENAEQILAAAKKLPPEPEKKGKTKN